MFIYAVKYGLPAMAAVFGVVYAVEYVVHEGPERRRAILYSAMCWAVFALLRPL